MQRTLFELMPAFLSESDEDLPGDNHVVDLKKQNRNSGNPTMCKSNILQDIVADQENWLKSDKNLTFEIRLWMASLLQILTTFFLA